MARFRQDNIEGYNDAELAEMNWAFDRSVKMRLARPGNISGVLDGSLEDRIAEEVQFAFDRLRSRSLN